MGEGPSPSRSILKSHRHLLPGGDLKDERPLPCWLTARLGQCDLLWERPSRPAYSSTGKSPLLLGTGSFLLHGLPLSLNSPSAPPSDPKSAVTETLPSLTFSQQLDFSFPHFRTTGTMLPESKGQT